MCCHHTPNYEECCLKQHSKFLTCFFCCIDHRPRHKNQVTCPLAVTERLVAQSKPTSYWLATQHYSSPVNPKLGNDFSAALELSPDLPWCRRQNAPFSDKMHPCNQNWWLCRQQTWNHNPDSIVFVCASLSTWCDTKAPGWTVCKILV